jgi:caa(3)-type oxidase subunit IV
MSEITKQPKIHVVPLKVYLAVGAALFLLTAVTVGVAAIPLGGWNAVAAISIATIKALLVALVFMHLWYDRKLFLIIFMIGILFLGIFMVFTMFDVLERDALYDNHAGPIKKEAVIYDTRRGPAGDSTVAGHR